MPSRGLQCCCCFAFTVSPQLPDYRLVACVDPDIFIAVSAVAISNSVCLTGMKERSFCSPGLSIDTCNMQKHKVVPGPPRLLNCDGVRSKNQSLPGTISLLARSGPARAKLDETSRRSDFDGHRNTIGQNRHRDGGSCSWRTRCFPSADTALQ
jgi:hypothetical protein